MINTKHVHFISVIIYTTIMPYHTPTIAVKRKVGRSHVTKVGRSHVTKVRRSHVTKVRRSHVTSPFLLNERSSKASR